MIGDTARFITRKLTSRGMRNRLRLVLRSLIYHVRIDRRHDIGLAQRLAPIFVIGTNRGGTSLCSYIISMHPQVEGIFSGEEGPRIHVDGHVSGYGESGHIWQSLNNPDHDIAEGEGFLFGLPSSVSKVYVRSASHALKVQLISELMSARATNNIPLIKLNHNLFRVPLIKELFPKARFVLITRGYRSYITSGKDKWGADREKGVISADSYIDYPHIGLHWLLANSIAFYDLKKYAKDDHVHIKLEDLHSEKSVRDEAISRVFRFLNLDPLEIPDAVFNDSYIYTRAESEADIDIINRLVGDLIDFETSLP